MERIAIICIDDEREVLEALVRDLQEFQQYFQIEPSESAEDAMQLIDELLQERIRIGLVLADHLMPGTSGVDFLIALNGNPETKSAKKVLVTAQAGLDDTVQAVNRADLDHYIRKPWTKETLHRIVVDYLTQYVLEQCEDPLPFVSILDGAKILSGFSQKRGFRPC